MTDNEGVRLRNDGRYEARYVKGKDEAGRVKYGSCYGKTFEEAKAKRDYQVQKLLKNKGLNLLILGAGSHGMDVYEIAKSLRIFSKINFLDDASEHPLVIGKWENVSEYLEEYPVAIVAVGDTDLRREWTERITALGFLLPILVHPTAFVPENTVLSPGTVVCARATIAAGVKMGRGSLVGTGSLVPRNTDIPDWGYYSFDQLLMDYHNTRKE